MAKKSSKNQARQKPHKAYAAFTPDKGTYVQRTHKDTLFRFIFRDKQKLLQLYNALSSSDYKDADLLTVTAHGKLQAAYGVFTVYPSNPAVYNSRLYSSPRS